jgi:hypothetical protein
VDSFYEYINISTKEDIILYVLQNYDYANERGYSAVVEKAYLIYIKILCDKKRYDEGIDICENHIRNLKNEKDSYLLARWYMSCAQLYVIKSNDCNFKENIKMHQGILNSILSHCCGCIS